MMKKLVLSLSIVFGLSSCISLDYIGKSYTPSENVEMYFDVADIPGNYEVIGMLSAEAPEIVGSHKIQQKMLAKAIEVGADAVLFEYMDKKISGSTTNAERFPFGGHQETYTTEDKVVQAKLIKIKA